MTVFDFIEIKKELIATLEGETDDGGALVTDVKYAEGTVRSRKDGDYRKQGRKWVKIYEKEGRGASLAVTHAVKKIKAAQSVDELMDLVNANISRFYDKNGKLLPVVARLRDAVNESKARINTERKAKEGEKQTQKVKTTSDEDKKQPSTPAETPTQKIEKPDFLNGRFNGKVYGNAKYGYRVYVDGKEKSITAEQKKQVDAWQKQEKEKKETQKETQKSVTNLENHLLDISLENSALDISNLASKAIKNPSDWEKYKKSDNVFSYPSNIAKMEKNANTPEEKSIIERLKTDKDFADTVNKTYIQLVENKMKQMKDEQSTKQGYDNRQTQIDDYIKANGKPDIVKNGFWNGKVYGSEKSGYSVYIDGKKKTLSEADKKQFGLK